MAPDYYHDIGGEEFSDELDTSDRPREYWELEFEVLRLLCATPPNSLVTLPELRRAYESFGREKYYELGFYERRLEAMMDILEEKDVVTRAEIVAYADQLREGAL